MTPPDDISGTGCISDKRKFCAHIKAHLSDISKHDRSDCGGCAIQEKTNASDYMSTLKFQDSMFDFFLSSQNAENRLLCQLLLLIRNEQTASTGGQACTHTQSVYTVLFGLFSY